jgi:hypothetical protein
MFYAPIWPGCAQRVRHRRAEPARLARDTTGNRIEAHRIRPTCTGSGRCLPRGVTTSTGNTKRLTAPAYRARPTRRTAIRPVLLQLLLLLELLPTPRFPPCRPGAYRSFPHTHKAVRKYAVTDHGRCQELIADSARDSKISSSASIDLNDGAKTGRMRCRPSERRAAAPLRDGAISCSRA